MDSRNRVRIGIGLAAALVLLVAGTTLAGVPKKINYQGRLTEGGTGLPLAGSHTLVLRIYDAPTGGSLLWSETKAVEADSAGVFAAVLGSAQPIDMAFDGPSWLETEADGEILSPRREMVSVPYAYTADSAGRASAADSLGGHGADEFVLKGETASITATMIVAGVGSGLDADLVDGKHASAFADTAHNHDGRYYTETELSAPGIINQAGNPVDWTKLKSVPTGFADGVDNAGTGDGYSLDAADGSPTDVVYVKNDGDVYVTGKLGVGTTNPAKRLDVNGDVNASSTFMLGGRTVLSEGNLSLFVGPGTGGSPGASFTVAVGDSAGYQSDEHYSTFVGYHAGYGSDPSSAPNGVNTFVGCEAGGGGNTGTYNTFLGARTGYTNTSGYANTFVGGSSGSNNATGNMNAFFGGEAGRDNEGGNYNTFVGTGAGLWNTGGNENTVLGTSAGHDNMTGSGNVFLGHEAGYHETGSGKLYIANGSDSNDVFLYGEFNAFKEPFIGVGCVSPASMLTVHQNVEGVTPMSPQITVGNHGGNCAFTLGSDAQNRAEIGWMHPDYLRILTPKKIAFSVGDYYPAQVDMLLDDNGNLGIGTTTPERRLHILGDGPRILMESTGGNPEINFENTDDTSAQRWAVYKHSTNDDLRFYQNGDRVTFQNSTGNVAIGSTDPAGYRLYVNGTAYATGSWQSSDSRLKTDLVGIDDALGKVLRLNGVSFRWRTEDHPDRGLPEGRHYGLVAQEVEQVLPEVVGQGPGDEKALAYSELIPVLVEAVKELKAESDELRAENQSLTQRLEALERAGDH